MTARVLFRGTWYEGELLYRYDFTWRKADETGRITESVQKPQRVGLRIEGVDTHFTIPTEVRT